MVAGREEEEEEEEGTRVVARMLRSVMVGVGWEAGAVGALVGDE